MSSGILALYEPRYEKTYVLLILMRKRSRGSDINAQLINAFVFATEKIQLFRTPKTGFLATRLIFNYNHNQPLQEGLSGCSQYVGMGRLYLVKAIHGLKYNKTKMIWMFFMLNYTSIMFSGFYMNWMSTSCRKLYSLLFIYM